MNIIEILVSVIISIIIITLIIVIHEFGHFIFAKIFKCIVPEFFIGFGKVLYKKKYKGTDYGIRLIPGGGFVKILGTNISEEDIPDENKSNVLYSKPLIQKILIYSGGLITHLILAYVFTLILTTTYGVPTAIDLSHESTNKIGHVIECVDKDSFIEKDCSADNAIETPAKKIGLKDGDIITHINGEPIRSWNDIITHISQLDPNGTNNHLTIIRDHKKIELPIKIMLVIDGRNILGISPQGAYMNYGFKGIIHYSYLYVYKSIGLVYNSFSNILNNIYFIGKDLIFPNTHKSTEQNTAPTRGNSDANGHLISIIGIVKIMSQSLYNNNGFILLNLIIQLNISLFAINTLPILPFDGGHIVISIYDYLYNFIFRYKREKVYLNYNKIYPITAMVVLMLILMSFILVINDIVNS